MSKDNSTTKERIARVEEKCKHMEKQLTFISRQVTNHIPTSIKEIDKRIDKIEKDLVKLFSIGTTVIVIVEFLINRFL